MDAKQKWLRQLITLLLMLGLTVVVLSGCGTNRAVEKNAGGSGEVAVYTIADSTGDWGFPSPYTHYNRGPGYVRMSFLFDTLVWKNDREYLPGLAEKWQYLTQENAYLFNLQKNVTWHDGEKFTSGDVLFTYNYVKAHPYQWADVGMIKKIEALDDYTVKMYLNKPYAPFLDTVVGSMPILPGHIWKNVQNPMQFQKEEALIGTGPYKLLDYNKEQGTYLYEAYDNYYLGKPRVKQLKFIKISNEMVGNALKQKQADAAQVPPELASQMEKEGFNILKGSHDSVVKIQINHRKEPLSNKEFRQALAYAVNRQELLDTTLRGYGLVGNPGLVPPDNSWYNPQVEQYSYNPVKTGEILAKLGYVKKGMYFAKDGKPLELELLISGAGSANTPGVRQGEMIKEQLEKAGIKVNLRSLDPKTLDSMVGEWKFDLALISHGGMGGEPKVLNTMITDKSFNSARYLKSEELNSLLQQQLEKINQQERRKLINRIQEIYAQEMPSLPLYYPSSYWVYDNQVKLFYTKQGIGIGVPIPANKMSFVK
ncbi:extracellular solute-binding protein family 5 [Desulfofarcimen acetoxidans DSM 771]|uniref:Extracellular solute-binding protein family 5 n=1 Tax=Desulfofarcimen acetoxidans (strain ATCC 49208 / DSM 771 / KCTC 5769 / VKM B-1644 / 5575) TaxID=485916 RepID=C8W442_DESAS|nr:ABC transporter substrate-binding protein [Desulfofarcimen acetoxidans]ACV61296.1 extracellular solute-binding protein family 5 [Desulfofarcimen acetoxidans DSM 771]